MTFLRRRVSNSDRQDDGSEASSSELAVPSPSPGDHYEPLPEDERWLEHRLSAEEAARCEPGMLSRYLRATGGDREHALKRIRDTLDWRARERPDLLYCQACLKDPTSHYMHVVGWDRQRRPVIYSCLELATNRSVADNTGHMLSCFESAIRLMPQEQGVESWVWVMDLYGFGLRDCDPRLAHKFFQLAGNYYPERLGHFFLISPPTAFSALWKGVYRFIDPVTREKIDFLNFRPHRDNSKMKQLFDRYFEPDTSHWLLAEIAENRSKVVVKQKAYSFNDLSQIVQAPESEEVEHAATSRRRLSGSGTHDHLGTPAFLKAVADMGPEALAPPLRSLQPSPRAA